MRMPSNTAAIWRERHFRSGLLVTSATHMPRALASFKKIGLEVTPWGADFRGHYPPNSIFDFLPDDRDQRVARVGCLPFARLGLMATVAPISWTLPTTDGCM